jgi:hypothetical protein
MTSARRIFGIGLCVGWTLGGCGASQEPTRQDRSVGDVKEGAPLGRDVADPGILAEASGYQPAKLPAGAEAPPAGRRLDQGPKRPDTGANADTQVKAAVRDLVNALKDGEVELALRGFDAEQVAPLMGKVDTLLSTYAKVDLLRRHLAKKLDDPKVERLLGPLWGGEAELKWEILDPDHASIAPNLTRPLFGPKATPTLQLVRQQGEWRFQLEAPLTAADADEIVAYHNQLQQGLDAIVDWVATSANVDEQQLQKLISAALQGQPVQPQAVPAAGKSEPAGEKGAQKEEEKPKPRGAKGGRPK